MVDTVPDTVYFTSVVQIRGIVPYSEREYGTYCIDLWYSAAGGRFVTVSKTLETVTKRGELGGIKRHCSIIRYESSLYEFRYKSSLRQPVLYRKPSLPPTCKKIVVIPYSAR